MATVPEKKDKKGGKSKKISLGDFLGQTPSSNWADETDDTFIPKEPGQAQAPPDARSASQWRNNISDAPRMPAERSGPAGERVAPEHPPFTCYAGNLPYEVTTESLRDFFTEQAVKNVRLVYDKETGKFKGFGYVEFETRDDLIQAVKLAGSSFGNRAIKLDISEQRPNDRDQRGGGAFGRGGGGGFRSEGAANFGRDSMGTGVVEQQPERPGRGRGGRGGGFGAGNADFNRDAMGSGTVEGRGAGGRGSANVEFSRDSMGSERPDQPARDNEARRQPQGQGYAPPQFSRDAMESQKPDEFNAERPEGRGRGRGAPRAERGEAPSFSRDTMGSEQPDAPVRREAPTFSRDSMSAAGASTEQTQPQERRPKVERAPPNFSRDAMQTEMADSPPERFQRGRGGGRGFASRDASKDTAEGTPEKPKKPAVTESNWRRGPEPAAENPVESVNESKDNEESTTDSSAPAATPATAAATTATPAPAQTSSRSSHGKSTWMQQESAAIKAQSQTQQAKPEKKEKEKEKKPKQASNPFELLRKAK